MFATGLFSIDDGITTMQRYHEKDEPWDGDPTLDEFDSQALHDRDGGGWHGYVSNVGDVATIHILKEYNNEKNISEVKRVFFLMQENGINEVLVEDWKP